MTDIADRYRKLADQMEAKIAAVGQDQWDNASPCEGWTARDVVEHVVGTPTMFLGFIGQTVPEGQPAVADDPLGAFRHVRAAVQSALDDPELAQQGYDAFMGPSTFEKGVDDFISADLVMHQWDLARATGQDETLDADEVARVHSALEQIPGEALRSPGAFGVAIEPAPDADAQTRFLNFTGRAV